MRGRFLFALIWAAISASSVWGQRAQPVIVFNDDGGWCWFEDQRAIVYKDKLVIGSVAAGVHDPSRSGNIEVVTYELATGHRHLTVLHPNLSHGPDNRYDDHNSPVFLVRPDGRILTVYSEHGWENHFYHRVSANPGDATEWQAERTFVPSARSEVTYSNLLWLGAENGGKGRIYDFFRGLDGRNKPSYAWSDDQGETWKAGNVFIDVPGEFLHRPYVRYVSNGTDTVHLFYTDGHPNEFETNGRIYPHACYRNGELYKSDGVRIRKLTEGLKYPGEGTRIFPGNAENIAWTSDIHLDREGYSHSLPIRFGRHRREYRPSTLAKTIATTTRVGTERDGSITRLPLRAVAFTRASWITQGISRSIPAIPTPSTFPPTSSPNRERHSAARRMASNTSRSSKGRLRMLALHGFGSR